MIRFLLCLLAFSLLLTVSLSDDAANVDKSSETDTDRDVETESKSDGQSEGAKTDEEIEESNDEHQIPEEKEVDEATKDLEEAALNDLDDLESYMLEIVVVPEKGDKEKIADKPVEYNKWTEAMEEKLKKAYEMANFKNGAKTKQEPVVKIVKTELIEEEESTSLKILFYVRQPPSGPVPGTQVEATYKVLSESELWDFTKRQTLGFPSAVKQAENTSGASRTISIIAFVLGWVCLSALIVILAYLGIKYRDGLKLLARRIQDWSNVYPNRTGYSNLGGDIHVNEDWRSPVVAEDDVMPEPDPNHTATDTENTKPKKKLRAPGGLLHEMEEGETITGQTLRVSYGGTGESHTAGGGGGIEMQIKDSTQLRLSDLTTNLEDDRQGGDHHMGGNVTPPMTPKSMQKHLIKKYQEKQVEEQSRGLVHEQPDEPLTASNSEVFPDDFADCVEEEEIFQVKP